MNKAGISESGQSRWPLSGVLSNGNAQYPFCGERWQRDAFGIGQISEKTGNVAARNLHNDLVPGETGMGWLLWRAASAAVTFGSCQM